MASRLTNPLKGEVCFTVGEGTDARELVLLFSTNALIGLEERLGASVDGIIDLLNAGASLKSLRTILWGGLQVHQPGLTDEEVGEIMDAVGIGRVGELMGQAFSRAFPTATRKSAAEGDEAAAGGNGGRPPRAAARRARGTGRSSSPAGSN